MKRIIGLLILILFFTGCRGKKDVEAPQENEINIDQPAASDENYPSREPRNNISETLESDENPSPNNMEPVELQRERISAISQEIFPTELWMFQQKENKPLQPEHQMLGAMMGNTIQRDEQYIWEASKNLLTDPTTHIDNYSKNYNVVILQEKIKHIMNGVELIDFGRPKIEGSLAEIAFLVQKDDSKMMGYIYWSFDEHWLIEDLALK